MPRSHQQIAEDNGTTLTTIKELSRDGVNVYNDDELKTAMSKVRHRVKPDAKLSTSAASATSSSTTIEDLKAAALSATDLNDAKIIKEKAMALQSLIKVEKEQAKLIPLAEVDERDTKIAAAVKGALMKLGNDQPPALEGMTVIDIQKRIKKDFAIILHDLADAQSEFWKDKKL